MNIRDIGREMNAQDNRMTQYPLFAITVDRKRYVHPEMDWEVRERKEEFEVDELCAECKRSYEEEDILPDECDDCGNETFDHFVVMREFDLNAGVFFTAKACEEHIAVNKHRYNNPKSFGIGAWRNPEMQTVMRFIAGWRGRFRRMGEIAGFYR